MNKIYEEQNKEMAYKLVELNYIISLSKNYISVLLSDQVGNEENILKIALFYHSLVKEKELDNISVTLSILKGRMEEITNFFLDEVEGNEQ